MIDDNFMYKYLRRITIKDQIEYNSADPLQSYTRLAQERGYVTG